MKTLTDEQVDKLYKAMSALLDQRSSADQEDGTDNEIIDAGCAVLAELLR